MPRVQWAALALRAAAVVGAVYVLLIGVLFFLQNRLIYPAPRGGARDPRDAGLADAERLELAASDGVRLESWILFPPGVERRALPLLLSFHGNAESLTHDAPILDAQRREGVAVASIDYRGYGLSGGAPSERGLIEDGLAALRAVRARPEIDPRRVVLHGRSLGSGVAIAVAAEVADSAPVAGVVIEAGFDSLRAVAKRAMPYIPAFLVRSPFDSRARVARVRCPILFLHGDADTIVPIEHGRALEAAAPRVAAFHVVAGAGHNDLIDAAGPRYYRWLADFTRDPAR